MLVKIEARILIFPGMDFHFPSTSVPAGTFLGSAPTCVDAESSLLCEVLKRGTFTPSPANISPRT